MVSLRKSLMIQEKYWGLNKFRMSELRRRLTPIEVDRLKVKLYEGFHESHEGLLEKNPKRYCKKVQARNNLSFGCPSRSTL